jgi:hypothetical protein
MEDITNVLKSWKNKQCQKSVKPLLNMSSNQRVTKSFNLGVAQYDYSYLDPFWFEDFLGYFWVVIWLCNSRWVDTNLCQAYE